MLVEIVDDTPETIAGRGFELNKARQVMQKLPKLAVQIMLFRPAAPTDAHEISALIQNLSQGFALNEDGSGAEQFWASISEAAEASYIASSRYKFTVAINANAIVGFIAMRDVSHVFHLFVAPAVQRNGLASQLWARAKAEAMEAGHLGAFTVNSSLTAVPVYERFGFIPTSKVVEAHGISFLPMQLPSAHVHG
jgi:GNAT superfamily N-acetyltransferase